MILTRLGNSHLKAELKLPFTLSVTGQATRLTIYVWLIICPRCVISKIVIKYPSFSSSSFFSLFSHSFQLRLINLCYILTQISQSSLVFARKVLSLCMLYVCSTSMYVCTPYYFSTKCMSIIGLLSLHPLIASLFIRLDATSGRD